MTGVCESCGHPWDDHSYVTHATEDGMWYQFSCLADIRPSVACGCSAIRPGLPSLCRHSPCRELLRRVA